MFGIFLGFERLCCSERDIGNTVEVSSVVSSIQETNAILQQSHVNTTATSGIATANSTLSKTQTRSHRRGQAGLNDGNESQQSASSFITGSSQKQSKNGIINTNDPLDRQLTDVSVKTRKQFENR